MILITVSSDRSLNTAVREALERNFRFEACWELGYEDAVHIRGVGPGQKCIVVIDFREPERAFLMAAMVDGKPQFAPIAVRAGATPEDLVQLMRAGMRDVLPSLTKEDLLQAARRAAAKLEAPEVAFGELNVFLPAKPGCGATTIALNTAAAISRLTVDPALLLDFDIRLGVTSFLLRAEGTHTMLDALQVSSRLDDSMWANLISECGRLHMLGSGAGDFSSPVPTERFSELLDFALRKYSLICADLPGSMEPYERETILRAKRIFMVCTTDIGALHVARRKTAWLSEMGVAGKVSVILNGIERRSALLVRDIEKIVQLPVRYLIPEGASEITRAVRKGVAIEGSSPLAKQIETIARDIAEGVSVIKKASAGRRFVEYFSVSHAAIEGKG
jgi:pilus assembly protein CpaE